MRKTLTAVVATAVLVGAAGMAQASTTTTASVRSEMRAVQADRHLNELLTQSTVAAQRPVSLVKTAAGSTLRFRPVATQGVAPALRDTATRWNRLVTDRRFTAIAAAVSLDHSLQALAQAGLPVTMTPAQCIAYAELVVLVLPVFLIIALGQLSCTYNLAPAAVINCELSGVNYIISNRISVLQYLVGFCLGVARAGEPADAVTKRALSTA